MSAGDEVDPKKQEEEEQEAKRSGGYKYQYDDAQLKEERQLAMDFMRTVGRKILSGNLAFVSLPVRIFEPRSFLERLVDNWFHFPELMAKACAAPNPVERLKYVVAACISGLHHNVVPKKPFNPILGETFEAQFEDGTKIFCEQTAHHPPVSHWEVIPPDGSYYFTGYGMWSASFSINTVRGKQTGPNVITFKDGSKIIYTLPGLQLRGILWGDRVLNYEGTATFVDPGNKLKCTLVIDPDKRGMISRMFSWGSSKKDTPCDWLRGEIVRVDEIDQEDLWDSQDEDIGDDESVPSTPPVVEVEKEKKKKKEKKSKKDKEKKEEICKCEGSWLSHLEFTDSGKDKKTTYWDVKSSKVYRPIPVESPLPSDSRFRADLIALKAGEIEKAQKMKEDMENIQRAEKKLREKKEKK